MRAFIVAATLLAASPLFTAADKPTFSPSNVSGVFIEQFTADWDERWSPSEATKEEKSGEEVFSYVGKWSVEEPSVLPGIEGDKGLVVKSAAAHHAISAPFTSTLDNAGKTLVVQYEVKLQDGLECGGAYLKLLTQSPKGIQAAEYSDKTPYTIMFGPDKCGMTNKVHFIFRHKNPKTGEYEEKHLKTPPSAKIAKTSTLYTLVVKPDNTFEILINNESAKSGSLLEDFDPAVNPEKEIDDPKDTKPEDWVDEARITDPDATKPDDWDEDAPFEIVDEDAEKPDDWYEDEPATIPDPDAEKPEDWDDEEDGDWIPPQISNPKCADAAGCGPWKKPMKKNPAYKGKWYAPMIDNPAYKGVWSPRKIPNPDYFEDKQPSNFEKMAGIGYELWTMQKDILFDNIYIGHSIEDAKQFADETWKIKYDIETAAEEAEKPMTDEAMDLDALTFWDDPLMFVQKEVQAFIPAFLEDPFEALQTKKEVAGGLAAAFVTLLALIGALLALLTPKGSPLKESAQKKKKVVEKEIEKSKEAAKEAADKVTETAKSTAADVAGDQDGLKKRTK